MPENFVDRFGKNMDFGLLGSAHFLGFFFVGCWWAPRTIGAVGYSRAFAAFTAAGSIGLITIASLLINTYGPCALFVFLAIGHGVLIIFGQGRMQVRETLRRRTAYVYTPRSSFIIGRLLRRQREKK